MSHLLRMVSQVKVLPENGRIGASLDLRIASPGPLAIAMSHSHSLDERDPPSTSSTSSKTRWSTSSACPARCFGGRTALSPGDRRCPGLPSPWVDVRFRREIDGRGGPFVLSEDGGKKAPQKGGKAGCGEGFPVSPGVPEFGFYGCQGVGRCCWCFFFWF